LFALLTPGRVTGIPCWAQNGRWHSSA
jgi:hypothetical protein